MTEQAPSKPSDLSPAETFANGRYVVVKAIGRGAYGVVYACKDTKTREMVAIKKLSRILDNLLETKRICREIRLMRQLDHENIIQLKDLFVSPDLGQLYITTEQMDTDLHQLIVSKQALTEEHIQYFIYQLLKGVLYLHSAGVIHRDIKPSNILVNQNCDLKLCDFGLARIADPSITHQCFMTEYVATRWYRAPEIMLSWNDYSEAVDIWSIGCLFSELLNRRPLFPGRDYLHQMKLVLSVIGPPCKEEWTHINSEASQRLLLQYRNPKVSFKQLMNGDINPLALDLLQKMLSWPLKRLDAKQCLNHEYLSTFYDEEEIVVRESPLEDKELDSLFSDENLTPSRKETLKEELSEFIRQQAEMT